MRNLAGVEEADQYIQEELLLADIPVIQAEAHRSEVPYALAGKLGPWSFTRAWVYWRVHASEGDGLPLDVAVALHGREYPVKGERQPKTYGTVIRAGGFAGGDDPQNHCRHFDSAGLQILVDRDGELEEGWKDHWAKGWLKEYEGKFHFVRSLNDVVIAKKTVDSYHIDTQLGLNEFGRVVKSLL